MNLPTQQDKDDLLTQSELTSTVGVDAYLRGMRDALRLVEELNPPTLFDSSAPVSGSSFAGMHFSNLCGNCAASMPFGLRPLLCTTCGHVNY